MESEAGKEEGGQLAKSFADNPHCQLHSPHSLMIKNVSRCQPCGAAFEAITCQPEPGQGIASLPCCSASDPVPANSTGNVMQKRLSVWAPEPMWEILKRLGVPGISLTQPS